MLSRSGFGDGGAVRSARPSPALGRRRPGAGTGRDRPVRTEVVGGPLPEDRIETAVPAATNRPRHAIAATALLCLALGCAQVLILRASGWDLGLVVLWNSLVCLYFASGLMAMRRQPHNPFGALLIVAGVCQWCAGLQTVPLLGLSVIGWVTASLPLSVLVNLILAFPNGRLRGRLAHVVVIGVYATSTVLQLPRMVLDPASPLFVGAPSAPWSLAGFITVQRITGLGLLIAAMVALGQRWFSRRRPGRLTPFVAYAFVCLLALALTQVSRLLAGWSLVFPDLLQLAPPLQALLSAVLPVVFLFGVLTGSFGRTGELREFLDEVGARAVSPAELDAAVTRAVGLPGCWIIYAADEPGAFVAADGSPARLPAPGEKLYPIRSHGRLVGALGYPHEPGVDLRLLESVAEASAVVISHQRTLASLHAALLDLRRSERALQESRRRIVSAEDRERRRIARDVHDGLQQSALMLGLQAGRLTTHTEPATMAASAAAVQDGISTLLTELRNLVQGILPAALVERGVDSAVRSMSSQFAVRVVVESDGPARRIAVERESTLYFCVLEAVTNAAKHADADTVTVGLTWSADEVTATVHDDGHGGAVLGAGSGLTGLRDRLAAFGGTLTVDSPVRSAAPAGSTAGSTPDSTAHHVGTTIRIALPCG